MNGGALGDIDRGESSRRVVVLVLATTTTPLNSSRLSFARFEAEALCDATRQLRVCRRVVGILSTTTTTTTVALFAPVF